MSHTVLQTPRRSRALPDFAKRPMLVFWEATRACPLACRHCRASATAQALPGELSEQQGHELIKQIAAFGSPHPVLVMTGGDCLLRPDLFELVDHAVSLGMPVALSPSVSPLLTDEMIARITDSGVKAVSVSLDGARAPTHDAIRGIPGHFDETVRAIRVLAEAGLKVQVNTTVMRSNVEELAEVAALLPCAGAHIWEVFFLVHVGRGTATEAITADEHEQVCHFLYEAAQHGLIVRTVEAPFFRRVAAGRRSGGVAPAGLLYQRLSSRLRILLGVPSQHSSARSAATRDGKGIVFIAHDGEVYPAGFLPVPVGNVRTRPLPSIYRNDPLLRAIRSARFTGRCGQCEYADLCGGSRARASASSGDPLGEDPACAYQPQPGSAALHGGQIPTGAGAAAQMDPPSQRGRDWPGRMGHSEDQAAR
jgi:AdoMet-dependent heme synthase